MKKESAGKKANVPAKEEYSFLRDFIYPIVEWSLLIIIMAGFWGKAAVIWIEYDCDIINHTHILLDSLLICGVISFSLILVGLVVAPNPPRLK